MNNNMNYTARQIVEPLESIAPRSTQEAWDNSGFLIGDPNRVVSGVLVALDCTPDVVDEAIDMGVNLIITHHPLIFRGVKHILPTDFVGSTITKLIKNDIILYSAHTNLDKSANGVSRLMADKLGLEGCEVLSKDGFGLIGNLHNPMGGDQIICEIKRLFRAGYVRCSKMIEEKICRVAVCGGAGRDFIGDAVAAGAQLYITGDIGYHNFYSENGFMIADVGHYESEFDVVYLIKDLVSENFANFAVYTTKRNNNPIYYY